MPAIVLGGICPQTLQSHSSGSMKMPMPDGGHQTPACCIQHHLASDFVPVFQLAAPVASTVTSVAGDAMLAENFSLLPSREVAGDRSPPPLETLSLRI